MADSDSDYIASSGDEAGARAVRKGGRAGAKASKPKAREKKAERWEEVQRAWDVGLEDDNIESTVAGLLEAGKKRRLLKDETPLQRGIIRHMVLILDMSIAMSEKDFRPNRYLYAIKSSVDFVREYFEQNPISQLAIVGMRDGLALRISDTSGNPVYHIDALKKLKLDDPQGSPSLQNGLEMARATLFHTPKHGTREVVVIFGALWSADPGDLHDTIRSLVADRIRVSVVGMAAQVAVCKELVKATNSNNESAYTVSLNDVHFRELLLETTAPPITRSAKMSANGLLMMGFPSRTVERSASLCACHSRPSKGGYLCSRCSTKVCALPVECPACGLTLILSTHLARSYHHLFPLRNFQEVGWTEARKSTHCFSCQREFPAIPKEEQERNVSARTTQGTSVSSRYRCPECTRDFCIDCDVFCHDTLYNCPGCQARPEEARNNANGGANGADSMIID